MSFAAPRRLLCCAHCLLPFEHRGAATNGVRRDGRCSSRSTRWRVFHLKNGARLERINWLGDTSAPGCSLQRSAGSSANYIYRFPDGERSHDLHVREHTVRASREIEALAKRFSPPARF
jgi:hypothetical protein